MFCGRAELWEGHELTHAFVPLSSMLPLFVKGKEAEARLLEARKWFKDRWGQYSESFSSVAEGYTNEFMSDRKYMTELESFTSQVIKGETMQAHQERVIHELNELVIKHTKLGEFINGKVFESLDKGEQTRLERQYSIMGDYAGVLRERITAFNPTARNWRK